ncbi:MAG: M17 family peptidase N-terminal domain-containing protein [Myxococcota bacterium]|jgi:hypothetical protein
MSSRVGQQQAAVQALPISTVQPDLPALDQVNDDALVALIFEGDQPPRGLAGLIDWRTDGTISRMAARGKITGEIGECVLFSTNNRTSCGFILFMGLGPRRELNAERLRTVGALAREKLLRAKVARFAFGLPPLDGTAVTWNEAFSIWLQEVCLQAGWEGVTIIDDAERVRKFTLTMPETLRRRISYSV